MSEKMDPKYIKYFEQLNQAVIDFNREYEYCKSHNELPSYVKESTHLSADCDAFEAVRNAFLKFMGHQKMGEPARKAANALNKIIVELKESHDGFYRSSAEQLYLHTFDKAGLTKGRAFNFNETYRRAGLAKMTYGFACELFEQYISEHNVSHAQIIDWIENPYRP